MKYDLLLAGVGGQGVLSLSSIIAWSAMREGLHVTQSELHGMSQRGGAVVAHLRIADTPVASSLVPRGAASLIVSLEPLEALRYLRYLAPTGALITATTPVRNIPDYPSIEVLLMQMRRLPDAVVVDAERLARAAGLAQATNMVMAGAASHRLPLAAATLEAFVTSHFARKGATVVQQNLAAFHAGREALDRSGSLRESVPLVLRVAVQPRAARQKKLATRQGLPGYQGHIKDRAP